MNFRNSSAVVFSGGPMQLSGFLGWRWKWLNSWQLHKMPIKSINDHEWQRHSAWAIVHLCNSAISARTECIRPQTPHGRPLASGSSDLHIVKPDRTMWWNMDKHAGFDQKSHLWLPVEAMVHHKVASGAPTFPTRCGRSGAWSERSARAHGAHLPVSQKVQIAPPQAPPAPHERPKSSSVPSASPAACAPLPAVHQETGLPAASQDDTEILDSRAGFWIRGGDLGNRSTIGAGTPRGFFFGHQTGLQVLQRLVVQKFHVATKPALLAHLILEICSSHFVPVHFQLFSQTFHLSICYAPATAVELQGDVGLKNLKTICLNSGSQQLRW